MTIYIYILGCPHTKSQYARVEVAYFGLSNPGWKLKIGTIVKQIDKKLQRTLLRMLLQFNNYIAIIHINM